MRIIVIFISIAILGFLLAFRLPVTLLPKSEQSIITINYSVPNSSPETVELIATHPLENLLSKITEIESIHSVSKYNTGAITIQFHPDTEIKSKEHEVRMKIRNSFDMISDQVNYPEIHAGKPHQEMPSLIYSVNSDYSSKYVQDKIEKIIIPTIQSVGGIKAVNVLGLSENQVVLECNPLLLGKYGISKQDIIKQLNAKSGHTALGYLKTAKRQLITITLNQSFNDHYEIGNILIPTQLGYEIPLEKLVSLRYESSKRDIGFSRVNGKDLIKLIIQFNDDENAILLSQNFEEKTNELNDSLAPHLELELEYDEAAFLNKELGKIRIRALLSISIIVLFLLLYKRNLKYLLVLLIGIAVNLGVSFLFFFVFNININLFSLVGITISFGLIVDNAIVVLDHLNKYRDQKIFMALTASSLTTVCALLLVFFLNGEDQLFMVDFALVIAINLLASLFVAFYFTPALNNLLVGYRKFRASKKRYTKRLLVIYYQFLTRATNYKRWIVILLILLFGIPIYLVPTHIEGASSYNSIIGSSFFQQKIQPTLNVVLGGTMGAFVRNAYEKYNYSKPEETQLLIHASLPYGHTPEQLNTIILNLEKTLSKQKGISKYITNVQSGQFAEIKILFKEDYEKGLYPFELEKYVIANCVSINGVEWDIKGKGRGYDNIQKQPTPKFKLLFKGYNYEKLEELCKHFGKLLEKNPRIQNLNINEQLALNELASQQYVLQIDQQKLSRFGIDRTRLLSSIYDPSKPIAPSLYLPVNNSNLPLFIQNKQCEDLTIHQLQNERVQTKNGNYFRVEELTELDLEKTLNTIYRQDRQYLRILSFDYVGFAKLGNQYLDKTLRQFESEIPSGFTFEKLSFNWSTKTNSLFYIALAIVLVIIIFFLCSILFENLKQPFLIISSIPLSYIGVFLTFIFFDFYIDQGIYAAFVLLGGLVVNSTIFICNDFNNLKNIQRTNKRVFLAIVGKSIPIFLTVLSSCLGLLPFLLDGQTEQFWFSFSVGTIGGLIFSLFVILILLPIFMMEAGKHE